MTSITIGKSWRLRVRTISELKEADWDDFVTISANAYPGIKIISAADRQQFQARMEVMATDPTIRFIGLYEDGRLLGVMRLFDFEMTCHNTLMMIGGVGGVAVDLAHKKQKVARDMLLYFLQQYRQRGVAITALYPFQPDFYRRMGFGYGTKMNRYRFRPATLPGTSGANATVLKEEDKAELQTCYGRFAVQTHGMMSRSTHYWDNLFSEPGLQTVGFKKNGHILGYAIFTFQPGPAGHFLNNELLVRELVYESKEALAELLTFLHTQADQIEHIIFNTQDDDFHYLLSDPRREGERMLVPTLYHESNIQGLGLMYRVIDVPRLFELLQNHDFNGQTCRLKLTIDDPFLPENSGSWVISFENGRSRIAAGDQYDVAIKIGVAEFSSLVMGTVSCHRLAAYGQAAVSDKTYLNTIDRLFHVPQKPVCMTIF